MNYYISKILKEKTITSYLEEKGIVPQKKSGEKIMYCCPIHAGDNDPSFVVYPVGYNGKEYQTYYCFGCHSGVTLINLKSALEKISTKESIRYFIKDIDIDNNDVRRSILEDFKNDRLGVEENKNLEMLMLTINSYCRQVVRDVFENDEEEVLFFENFYAELDEVARSKNIDLLRKIFGVLVKGVEKRRNEYKKKKEERLKSSMNWSL